MDPKSLPSLDPKLKEAYERVMATSLPANNSTTPVTPPVQPHTPPPTAGPTATPNPTTPTSPPPQAAPVVPEPIAPKPQQEATASYVTPGSSEVKTTATSSYVTSTTIADGKPKFSPVILIVAGAIFFVVYTLFWLRFFNVSLPFLP